MRVRRIEAGSRWLGVACGLCDDPATPGAVLVTVGDKQEVACEECATHALREIATFQRMEER